MAAILFGSIATLADTSEVQRRAYNDAFAVHGLDWHWDRDQYRAMLEGSGGQDRVAAHAASRGESVDAAAVHATTSDLFRAALANTSPEPRPGVVENVRAAREAGVGVGLVTTTSRDNVTAVLAALRPQLGADDFDVVIDASQVDRPKPDPGAYALALRQLGEAAGACVAVEDDRGGLEAAVAAGVSCVAFPNANTAGHDFTGARATVEVLEPRALVDAVTG